MKSQPHGQWVHTPPTDPPSHGHPPNLSEMDTLILENLKLQAQVVTLTAQLASLQARLDVQELQQKYVQHLNSLEQPKEKPPTAEEKEHKEWAAFHEHCAREAEAAFHAGTPHEQFTHPDDVVVNVNDVHQLR